MVEIECPHCEKDIQLDDGAFGLFECPHCEEEFTWNKESISDHEDYSGEGDFLIGFLAPILITFFEILIVSVTISGWYHLNWFLFVICLYPFWALGIAFYGHIQMRRSLSLGAFVSAAIWVISALAIVAGLAI
jgi:hypothetical protein